METCPQWNIDYTDFCVTGEIDPSEFNNEHGRYVDWKLHKASYIFS